MVIIISYNKQKWNEYNDSQNVHKNLANGAIISADKLNHMENGISNNDTNKVTDNKDDTEQLNGVRVQPYNKLSDVTNLRNIVLQTDNVISYTAKGGIGESIQDFPIYSGFSSLPSGTQVYYSYDLVVKNADGGVHWFGWGSPWDAFISNKRITKDGINHFQGTTTIPDVNSKQWIHSTIDNSHATYQITNLMIVVGSIPAAHLPAPEDKVTDNKNGSIQVNGSSITPADDSKVVHSKDMRKSASDVAGIEEVNAKQDKIGYTPADDSKVVHTTGDETIDGKKKFDTDPTDGAGNAYAKTVDVNQQLNKKVVDNKDGTEQLNGVKVQPFNKLSDTIGGRNVLLGTQVDNVIPSIDDNNYNFHVLNPTTLVPGKVYTFSAEVILTGSSDSLVSIHLNGPDINTIIVGTDSFPADGNRHSWSFTCPTGTTVYGIVIYAGVTGHTAKIGATWHHIKIEQGSIATDWTPAPEDKVNVSDMRKPASDVAGIEEVNAKQDKIGYTPADDSKVVHTADTSIWQKYPITDVKGALTTYVGPVYPYVSLKQLLDKSKNGIYTVYIDKEAPDTPDSSDNLRGIIQLQSNQVWGILNGESTKVSYYVGGLYKGNISGLNWVQFADDSKVVHSTDMRKPASDVAGIEEVNTKQNKIGYTPADDSKVAHLSGANNFDTVPTVNNNPLLLASSLPSDLARTGSNQEFTGKNTFDTAPIDKTSGKPYITKDGVPKVDLSSYATNNQLATKADDSKVVHSKDMRKPASDVAGIEEVNTKQDKISYTPADDSKVVHNSGTEEISGQKTFDTAPIDKTTGNPYITKSDLSNGLSTKVTDNKDGLSTKVTDNKDNTITANNVKYDLSKTGLTPIGFVNSGSFNDLPLGTVMANATTMTDGPTDTNHGYTTTTFYSSEWGGRKAQIAIADNANLMYFRVGENIDTSASWNSWVLLSDDSKVVHSKDMRKPASDVAGLEEVNAKQDKIGYTPADDSKVVHSTITQLNSTDMNTVLTAGFYRLNSGTNGMPNADEWTIYQVIPLNSTNGVQIAFQTNHAILGMRSWNNYNKFTDWVQVADDSKVVHTSDMRKPASDVAGIEEVNAKQDKLTITPADNSKVAHLSGANNFDTVPTVDNNPLLLASSLPSDLARTGSNQEFTGKNTFDTAPIDKTTGNPYITKDGVPAISPTLADTTKDANFTGKLQKSGIDVATTTDVTKAVNTATSNSSKYIKASNNDENSAISDSTSGNSDDIYYWCEN